MKGVYNSYTTEQFLHITISWSPSCIQCSASKFSHLVECRYVKGLVWEFCRFCALVSDFYAGFKLICSIVAFFTFPKGTKYLSSWLKRKHISSCHADSQPEDLVRCLIYACVTNDLFYSEFMVLLLAEAKYTATFSRKRTAERKLARLNMHQDMVAAFLLSLSNP